MRHVTLLAVIAFAAIAGCSRSPDAEQPAPAANALPSLTSWMKSNASTALNANNFEKLELVFERLKTLAPSDPEFASWTAIAAAGARAAATKNVEGVRIACKNCHETHRAAYRSRPSGRSI